MVIWTISGISYKILVVCAELSIRRISAVFLLAVFVVAVALVELSYPMSDVLAGGDEIEVVSHEVTADFPEGITFRVTATSPDTIEEIRVFYKPLGSNRSIYNYLETEPGTLVNGEYVMPTGTAATHKPPGTVFRYSFEIRDSAGRVLRTDDEDFLYMDDSLEWNSVSEGLLTVYYFGAFVENRAKAVLETIQRTIEEMGAVLGIAPKEPIKIVTYSNYRDMSRALPFRSQAVREDLETQGMAWPEERVLLVLISGETVMGIASHEFTHILVGEAAGRGYSLVPSWLNEGLAEYGNQDPAPNYDWALNYAIFTRRLKPLWYLDTFSGTPDDIVIAYGHGKSVVRYMIEVYGEEKMAELMRAFHTARSTDQALQQVYGFDVYGLDSQWRRAIGLDPLLPPDELARQLTPGAPSASAGEADVSTQPSPQAQVTPAAELEQDPAAKEKGRSTRSCSAPAEDTAGLPLDAAALALMAGPFFALSMRWALRRNALDWVARLRRRRTVPPSDATWRGD